MPTPPSVRTARVPALAKINLTLKVLHKRPDNYHELRTVFQTISLGDFIGVEYRPAKTTSLHVECTPEIPGNIILRAAAAILQEMRLKADVRFRLRKRIPMGGGLGGGSANAAAVLLALPALGGKRVPIDRLTQIAAALGSDVPFFLCGGTALGLGRGEELYAFPEPRVSHGLLLTPRIHVSTPQAFLRLGRDLTVTPDSRIINSFQSFSWEVEDNLPAWSWRGFCQNDFEEVVFAQHPEIRRLKKKLISAGASVALMTGSGSAVFGFFPSRPDAVAAAKAFPNIESVVFRTVKRARYRSLWWECLGAHALEHTWPPLSRYAE
ncbi:MAG: 4-(cytidine 5'-diphospho)-2-C-methyl-D-erythritol kinase [Bryobacterales bacterium]|nr:4-(cytidine 5'-diphospho)-2-C-methyl-D-erythritol kinase [Bryobacterales bacterium]